MLKSWLSHYSLNLCKSGFGALPLEFLYINQFFFKKNVRYPMGTCRDRISLIVGTRFSILGTRIGSLKRLKKPVLINLLLHPIIVAVITEADCLVLWDRFKLCRKSLLHTQDRQLNAWFQSSLFRIRHIRFMVSGLIQNNCDLNRSKREVTKVWKNRLGMFGKRHLKDSNTRWPVCSHSLKSGKYLRNQGKHCGNDAKYIFAPPNNLCLYLVWISVTNAAPLWCLVPSSQTWLRSCSAASFTNRHSKAWLELKHLQWKCIEKILFQAKINFGLYCLWNQGRNVIVNKLKIERKKSVEKHKCVFFV